MKTHYYILICILAILSGCKHKNEITKIIAEAERQDNPYIINAYQVGKIIKGYNIHKLYSLYPASQIKLQKNRNGLFNNEFDDYNIYDNKGKLQLTVTPEITGDTSSLINRIIIRDTLYKTDKGIGLNATLGEIRQQYLNLYYLPSSGEIVVTVPAINTSFLINKNKLTTNWWNNVTNEIKPDNIPDSVTIDAMIVFWNSKQDMTTHSSFVIFTADFWQGIASKLITWCIVELPSIAILIILFSILLRFIHFMAEKMKKLALYKAYKTENVDNDEARKRITTLTGIIHGIGKIFLWTIFLLILLGKFNINIAPILASAGIVGLAVGFGAQELVRDFISGFFILLENQLRTGDWAIINGTEGLVEKIELRTVTLRDSSGTVHIFQNGKINSLSNMTKEWSAIVLNIGIAYKEDTDFASQLMQEVGDDMQKDPMYKDLILEPITISGVNDFADSAVVIRVVLKTKPMQQWAVGREYRRRLKKIFDANHVEFPFPYRTITWGDSSNPIRLQIDKNEDHIH